MNKPTVSRPQWTCETQVSAHEVHWTLRPARPHLEDVEPETLLTLSPRELLAYVHDLRADLDAMRATMKQAIELVARQHDQLGRATGVIEAQRRELRAQRQRAAA